MANKKGNTYIIDKEKGIAKIELKRRGKDSLWTIIDIDDLEKVLNFPYTWFSKYYEDIDSYYACATEYLYCENGKSKNRLVYLHQYIMDADGKIVDHKNHNTLDNTRANIKVIADKHNSTNRKTRNSNNKSGYRNVSWSKSSEKWIIQLQINGKNKILGYFPYEQLEEAGAFAEQMRQKYYGEYAGMN